VTERDKVKGILVYLESYVGTTESNEWKDSKEGGVNVLIMPVLRAPTVSCVEVKGLINQHVRDNQNAASKILRLK
jgi:hypothetical protein